MLQYLLTGLAGVALGIAAMRVMQSRDALTLQGHDETSENTSQETSDRAPGKNRKLLIGAGALLAIAIAVLIFRGDASRLPLSSSPSSSVPDGKSAQLDDVNTMISRLAERLEKNPDDGEGFRMLGWSYVMTGKPDQAIAPYKQALRLLPGNALVLSGYGEALVGAAGGKVTAEAKGMFEQTLKLDPTEPRARHFEALWLSQNGKEKQALEKWIALVNSAPSDASWQADVMRRINDTAQKLGITVDGRIRPPSPGKASGSLPYIDPAAIQSANEMPDDDRQAMINGMVNGLAAKLKENPNNSDGWLKLLRSRMVLGQGGQAAKDLTAARKALAKDPVGLSQVNAVAREVGVPGA